MRFGIGRLALPAILLAGSACDQSITEPQSTDPSTARAVQASPGGSVSFNPQPEPPAMIVSFEILGLLDGLGRGEYRLGDSRGALIVETLASQRQGQVLHLRQRWTVHPPEPVIPPDPVHPPEPVQPIVLELKGILQPGGRLVLNGGEGMGGGAHARGIVTTGTGGISIGVGELMFNPQPEPPAQRR